MFFAFSIPLVDFRDSIAVPTYQLKNFRSRRGAKSFLRGFGEAESTAQMEVSFGLRPADRYHAGNAVDFEKSLEDKTGLPAKASVQTLFRDATVETYVAGSVLLGGRVVCQPHRCLQISDLLALPLEIAAPAEIGAASPEKKRTFTKVALAKSGPSVARLFLHATTTEGAYPSVDPAWVQPCAPLLIAAIGETSELVWPADLTKVSIPGVGPVWSGWTTVGDTPLRILLFEYLHARDEIHTRVFQGRLIRLHVEEEIAIRFASALVTTRGNGFVPSLRPNADQNALVYQDWTTERLNRMKDKLVRNYGHRSLDLLKPSPETLRPDATKTLERKLKKEPGSDRGAMTTSFEKLLSRMLGTTGNVVINNGGSVTNITGSFNNSSFTNSLNNSFNTVEKSKAPDEAKEQVRQLSELLKQMGDDPKVEDEKKDEAKRRFDALSQEVAAPKPDKDWLSLSGKGLIEAAKTCAKIAAPVAVAVKALLPLFGIPI